MTENKIALSGGIFPRSSLTNRSRRGIGELRLTLFAVLVGIGLTVGLGVPASWWVRLVAAVGSVALTVIIFRVERTRHLIMAAMEWILRRR